MMKIQEKFSELKNKKEGALIGYVMAGDPSPEPTVDIANALIKGGVDILELGLPFSDPIADGPTIQKSGGRALKAGMNSDIYFDIVKKIDSKIPLVCMTYYNLILQRGLDKFTKDCKDSGISGLIVPDLPIEESDPLLQECKNSGIDLIFLVASTTTEERMKKILESATGFLYVVSLLGVTGARDNLSDSIKPTLDTIRKQNPAIPIAVGFGISKPEHVKDVLGSGADGVIVGSAFIRIIADNLDNKEKILPELEEFAKKLKDSTR